MGGGCVLMSHLGEGETEAGTVVPVLGLPRAGVCGLVPQPFYQKP